MADVVVGTDETISASTVLVVVAKVVGRESVAKITVRATRVLEVRAEVIIDAARAIKATTVLTVITDTISSTISAIRASAVLVVLTIAVVGTGLAIGAVLVLKEIAEVVGGR